MASPHELPLIGTISIGLGLAFVDGLAAVFSKFCFILPARGVDVTAAHLVLVGYGREGRVVGRDLAFPGLSYRVVENNRDVLLAEDEIAHALSRAVVGEGGIIGAALATGES